MPKGYLIVDSDNVSPTDFDLVIVGAGIAGINAAYRYQSTAPVGSSYTVLEARDAIGGTWDLFRYPGIRSDSDIYTFSFEWNPWPGKTTLATGSEIKDYLIQSAAKTGIDHHIRYQHKVINADWSSQNRHWKLSVSLGGVEEPVTYHCRYIYLATGYFDHEQPLHTTIPGIERFQGKVIHPQFWPKDFNYTNKEVVVIGSGATAITIVPSMTKAAKHVTMLQRSPTYIMPLAQSGLLSSLAFTFLPRRLAYLLHRLGWIFITIFMILSCRLWPGISRAYIRFENVRHLPKEVSWDPHFNPRYKPWEQRLCASMDGDIFTTLRQGKASVVTDTIDRVTENTIELASGDVLHPDVIVTATGLKLLFAGGMNVLVDGKSLDYANAFLWKGSMLQDVPNLFFTIGFENAAWTLGCDCAALLMVRVLQKMRDQDATVAVPHLERHEMESMVPKPLFSLSATYLQSVNEQLPKGGSGVWAPRTNYPTDLWKTMFGDIETGLNLH